MIDVKDLAQPINQRVIDRLKPEIGKMLREMNVQEVEWREDAVFFRYLDLRVSIAVKSQIKNERAKTIQPKP